MTCGGKNHRSNCNCPIGRIGSAMTVDDRGAEPDLLSHRLVPPLYIKPIVRCPVCSKTVFFCALPKEGRVFFDSIGKPWKKHECTDKFSDFNLGSLDDRKCSWSPVENVTVALAEYRVARLAGYLRGENFVTFIRISSLSDSQTPEKHLLRSFVQARRRANGGSDLVLLTPEMRPDLIRGFVSALDAFNSAEPGVHDR